MFDIDIFHHIGLITRDMARLIARYEQLGFMFTPLSMPRIALTPGGAPEMLGAGNRHAIFTDNYLEVLGVVDAARWASITKAQRGAFDIDPPLSRRRTDRRRCAPAACRWHSTICRRRVRSHKR